MEKRNKNKFKLNHKNAVKVPYSGKERRIENDPSYFGYFALEGIERRTSEDGDTREKSVAWPRTRIISVISPWKVSNGGRQAVYSADVNSYISSAGIY